jgi:hypothetical protein
MSSRDKALVAFSGWYGSLAIQKAIGGPAKGTIAAALVVLEHLKKEFNLDLEDHRAAGGSQIKGASGAAVAKILARHGENRPFAKEGGRTNRGGPGDIRTMLDAIKSCNLEQCSAEERENVLEELQAYLVDRVKEYHNRERIKIVYDRGESTWQAIHMLLSVARNTGKEGPVAQHLIGAKLVMRFPEEQITNESFSTADDQLGREGDFQVGDTVFHVTVAPMPAVYEKCKKNALDDLAAYLVVPERVVVGTRQIAENVLPGKIRVVSIESFVAQNLEEMATFVKHRFSSGFRRLLDLYNERVNEAEIDKSLLIEIPKQLEGRV